MLVGALAAVSVLAWPGSRGPFLGAPRRRRLGRRNLSVVLPQNLRLVYDYFGSRRNLTGRGSAIVVAAAKDRSVAATVPAPAELSRAASSRGHRWRHRCVLLTRRALDCLYVGNGLRRLSIDGGEPVLLAPRQLRGWGRGARPTRFFFTLDLQHRAVPRQRGRGHTGAIDPSSTRREESSTTSIQNCFPWSAWPWCSRTTGRPWRSRASRRSRLPVGSGTLSSNTRSRPDTCVRATSFLSVTSR